MKNIVRLAFMWICASTMASNLNADISMSSGNLKDWSIVEQIAIKMHTELFEELGQKTPPGYFQDRMNGLKDMVKSGALKLICCYNNEECIGFCTFRIEQEAAYLGSCSYDENKITDLEFKQAFKIHMLEYYPEVVLVFAADMFPSHEGPVITKYRNRWAILGFVRTDDPRAKLCVIDPSKRDGAQGYVLTLSSEGDTDFNLPD